MPNYERYLERTIKAIPEIDALIAENDALRAELAKVTAERDAAVKDLSDAMPHWCCKNKCKENCHISAFDGRYDCRYCGIWAWRGVCDQSTKGE